MATRKFRKSRKKSKVCKTYCKTHLTLILIIAFAVLLVFVLQPTAKIGTSAPGTTPPAEIPANETKTVSYVFPGGIPPQLKITSLINTPTFLKVGETTLIRLYIKNVGSDSQATTATIKINNELVATLDVPVIYRNAQAVLRYNFTATAVGNYIVEANVTAAAGEKVLDDNFATISFAVTA